jgi:DNA-binding HxlR family transcriptional regulator
LAALMTPRLCECPAGPAGCQAPFCPYYHYSVELIGRRWTGDILRAMLHDVHRYCELRARILDISDRMLSERLRELEAAGLIRREVIPDVPVRVEYHLTPTGEAVRPVVESIGSWAAEWMVR